MGHHSPILRMNYPCVRCIVALFLLNKVLNRWLINIENELPLAQVRSSQFLLNKVLNGWPINIENELPLDQVRSSPISIE